MRKSKDRLFSYSLLIMLFVVTISVSCKKKEPAPTVQETGTVTDADNNTYKTVKIGNQWWMAENLKTTKFRNGRSINHILPSDPDTTWANSKKGSYCIFGNNTNGEFDKFGVLYNWYVVNDTNNIAPAGWHVPSDDEWKTLEIYLGMSQTDANKVNWRGTDEANKLKAASPLGWTIYGSIWSTNESGFTALGSCCRLFDATWGNPGTLSTGFWWTSTQHPANDFAWYRYLDYKNTNVFRYNGSKNYGMSIRCVKD